MVVEVKMLRNCFGPKFVLHHSQIVKLPEQLAEQLVAAGAAAFTQTKERKAKRKHERPLEDGDGAE